MHQYDKKYVTVTWQFLLRNMVGFQITKHYGIVWGRYTEEIWPRNDSNCRENAFLNNLNNLYNTWK